MQRQIDVGKASKHVFLQRIWDFCWRVAIQLGGKAITDGMIMVLRGSGMPRMGVG